MDTEIELSNDAKAVLMILSMTTLTMGNEEQILTQRANNAISELILAGYVEARKANDCRAASMTYIVTKAGMDVVEFDWSKYADDHFKLTKKVVSD